MAFWGKIGEKCRKCVTWSKSAKKQRKMVETPPKFFWQYNRVKRLSEKKGTFFTHFWPKFGRNREKKNGFFGDFEKAKFPKFRPKLAEKQHLLKKNFFQFFVRNLAHIHRKVEVHSPKSGGAIWRSIFWCTDRNCIIFGSPWHIRKTFQKDEEK